MKKYSLLLISALFMVINPMIGQMDQKQLYQHKMHTYKKMNSTGWALIGTGSAFALGSGIYIATLQADQSVKQSSDKSDYNRKMSEANICMTVGIGLLAGGFVLKAIGAHKVVQYRNKLKNVSMDIICAPNKNGILMTYRF